MKIKIPKKKAKAKLLKSKNSTQALEIHDQISVKKFSLVIPLKQSKALSGLTIDKVKTEYAAAQIRPSDAARSP